MASHSTSKELPCPTCQKRGAWFQGSFGPFCSSRCKWVDLGKWLGEEYVISSPLADKLPNQQDELE